MTGLANSVTDLCIYWAIRAVRSPDMTNPFPAWVPLDALRDSATWQLLKSGFDAPANQRLISRKHLYVLSSSCGRSEVEDALKDFGDYEFLDSNFADFINGKDWIRGFREEHVVHSSMGAPTFLDPTMKSSRN